MKKFIALAVALVSLSAVAHNHDHGDYKHMVTLGGYEGDRTERTLDFYWSSDDAKNEKASQNIALNYAYAITQSWQVGGLYKNYEVTTNDKVIQDNQGYNAFGLFVIYNFAGKLTDTNWLKLGYTMKNFEESDLQEDLVTAAGDDDDKLNTISLEFGHRFSLGHLWSMDFNWSPSIEVSRATNEPAASGSDDVQTTSVALNVLRVDVLF